jgi:hypothetical protein
MTTFKPVKHADTPCALEHIKGFHGLIGAWKDPDGNPERPYGNSRTESLINTFTTAYFTTHYLK